MHTSRHCQQKCRQWGMQTKQHQNDQGKCDVYPLFCWVCYHSSIFSSPSSLFTLSGAPPGTCILLSCLLTENITLACVSELCISILSCTPCSHIIFCSFVFHEHDLYGTLPIGYCHVLGPFHQIKNLTSEKNHFEILSLISCCDCCRFMPAEEPLYIFQFFEHF